MKASHVILCLTVLAAAADNSSAQPTEQQLRSDWANLARFRDANTKLQPPLKNENRVVFMGNSITEGWLQYFPAMFPGKPYINRGIGGQTTPQMLVRFRPDVIALKPKVVVILAGTNDKVVIRNIQFNGSVAGGTAGVSVISGHVTIDKCLIYGFTSGTLGGFGVLVSFASIPAGAVIYALGGLVIFAGLVMYDFQRLRATTEFDSAPLLAASIFLDILNVFQFFLSLFGRTRR